MSSKTITELTNDLTAQRDDLDNVISTLTSERNAISDALGALSVQTPVQRRTARQTSVQMPPILGRKQVSKRDHIVAMINMGWSPVDIADKLGCSKQYVYNVKRDS